MNKDEALSKACDDITEALQDFTIVEGLGLLKLVEHGLLSQVNMEFMSE